MAIQLKREYNNGLFDVQEIYDNEFKILEKPNGYLWNTSEEDPITVAKSRRGDYFETTEPVDPIEEIIENEEESQENTEQEIIIEEDKQ